jgi:hypothetical protein
MSVAACVGCRAEQGSPIVSLVELVGVSKVVAGVPEIKSRVWLQDR